WVYALYQTWHALALTIFCPALHPNALAKSGLFCRVPFTRNRPGECGSVLASSRELSGVEFWHHTWAKPRKKRCSAVNPSFFAPALGLLAISLRNAARAIRRPPLSAVFSPRVSRPFRCTSSTGTNELYSSAIQSVRFSNSVRSVGVHQLVKFPSASNLLPWSSKP